jgi:hypothetical protein
VSNTGGGGGGGGGTAAPPAPPAPPSSAGATSGSQESIAHKLHLPWWPQGDTGKLREAARAYRACASALAAAAEQGQRGISQVTGSNTGKAVDAIGAKWSGTYYGRSCLANPCAGAPAFDNAIATCNLLASACEQYAQHIDDAKHRLEELAAELVAGLVVGGLLTFVTAGLSDAAAAANAARVVAAALELADAVGGYVTIAFRIGGLVIQGALIGAGSDLAMQTVRIDLDPQQSFSFTELATATEFGAAANPVLALGAGALTRLPTLLGTRSISTTLNDLTTLERTSETVAQRAGTPLGMPLDAADRSALREYTQAHPDASGQIPYRQMNSALRDGGAVPADLQRRIDAVTAALAKLPSYRGLVFRGTDLTPDVLARYGAGADVTEAAFTSTSADAAEAFGGNTRFTIESTDGKLVTPYSAIPSEDEVLFPPGTRFHVLSKEWDDEFGWLIALEELAP